jgi:hypothetical protein
MLEEGNFGCCLFSCIGTLSRSMSMQQVSLQHNEAIPDLQTHDVSVQHQRFTLQTLTHKRDSISIPV